MRYLKVPFAEADVLREIPEAMVIDGLNIDPEAECTDYLIWEVIEDYSYVNMAIYDLENKNRMYPSSEEEVAKWEALAEDKGWEIVDEKPQVDVEL